MESLCLSTTSILRCASFTRLEVILLIIPTAIEVLFATSLLVAKWGKGSPKRYMWITAEGWIYFVLALIELLSHIIPAARDRADVFKVLDIILAATSVVPIFCYILFLFLFTRAELLDILPRRLQIISKLLLVIFIPTIVVFSELSSFIGISRTTVMAPFGPVIAIGFATDKDMTIWTFLTSLTLAFLTAYQAINFSFCFYRLIKAVLNQRRIEAASSDEAHFLRGIGWITGGIKLGAIETVVGFAANGFGSAMTRRIMRLLARASLIIGLIRGVDSSEDFTHLEEELSGARPADFRRSRLLEFISNPRHSTFRQLTPTATAFHSTPRAPKNVTPSALSRSVNGLARTEKPVSGNDAPDSDAAVMVEKPPTRRERVTIHFENGAPSLHMRFSALEVPDLPAPSFDHQPLTDTSAKDVAPITITSRRATFHAHPSHRSSLLDALGMNEPVVEQSIDSHTLRPATTNPSLRSPSKEVYSPPTNAKRIQSTHNMRSTMESYTSLSMVRDLASQFPALPPRRLDPIEQSPPPMQHSEFWDDTASVLSQVSTVKPETQGLHAAGGAVHHGTARETTGAVEPSVHLDTSSNAPGSTITAPISALSGYVPTPATQSIMTALTDDPYMDFGSALGSGKSRAFVRDSGGTPHHADWIDYDAIPGTRLPPVTEESEKHSAHTPSRYSRKSGSLDTLRISWLKNPDTEQEEPQLARAVSLKSHVARIKSVGKAPVRATPRPIRTTHPRGSLHIEHIQIPAKEFSDVEIIQGSFDSAYGRSVLRDSDVLGNESFAA